MDENKLPRMLRQAGIATPEQAERLADLIAESRHEASYGTSSSSERDDRSRARLRAVIET